MEQAIITAKNLNKVFKVKSAPVWVIKNVTIEVQKGEFVILFGPSGCGKSTLLNLLLGLERPTNGEIRLFGMSTNNLSDDGIALVRKENVGIVYQQPNWIKSQTVVENVAFPLLLRGVEEKVAEVKAREWLDKLELSTWAGYRPTELSAGQQQKVALARALVTEPQLIVADEPTGNLDYASGQELMQLFKKLQSEGRTVVLVTHERDSLMYASRIARMLDGVIVKSIDTQSLTKEGVLREVDTEVTRSLFSTLVGMQPDISKERQGEKKRRQNPITAIKGLFGFIADSVKSLFLISLFLVLRLIIYVFKKLGLQSLEKRLDLSRVFTPTVLKEPDTINSISLFKLALSNLFTKRLRAFVTIGGVGLGIGFIVILISIGYGVEKLVIDRVAGLNELRQAEVLPSDDGMLPITPEVVHDIGQVKNVEVVLPIISVAGRVSYSGSSTDLVAYGVQRKLFDLSDYQLLAGEYYEDEEKVDTEVNTAAVVVLDGEVQLPEKSERLTVVSGKFVELLGLNSASAIGQEFQVSFIAGPPLVASNDVKYTSTVTYRICGVISEREATEMYVPLGDLQDIGLGVYSQARVVAFSEATLSKVRAEVETMGYTTSSVTDTVAQIEQFFGNVRTIFGVIGVVALVIGALGMFNTLTVSLLERTREIGLLKAIGMRSNEVSRLLLSEAMTMGWLGGAMGILIGVIGGKLLSLVFTAISLAQGLGALDITYVPFWFGVFVLFIAVLVGAITGIIPVRYARNISPIDALRYE